MLIFTQRLMPISASPTVADLSIALLTAEERSRHRFLLFPEAGAYSSYDERYFDLVDRVIKLVAPNWLMEKSKGNFHGV